MRGRFESVGHLRTPTCFCDTDSADETAGVKTVPKCAAESEAPDVAWAIFGAVTLAETGKNNCGVSAFIRDLCFFVTVEERLEEVNICGRQGLRTHGVRLHMPLEQQLSQQPRRPRRTSARRRASPFTRLGKGLHGFVFDDHRLERIFCDRRWVMTGKRAGVELRVRA